MAVTLTAILFLLYIAIHLGWIVCPWSQDGITCPSCGMTRDINDILSGKFSNMRNPASIWVFIFLILQTAGRGLLALILRSNKTVKPILGKDLAISTTLFCIILFKLL